jgi:hypothetical protein
MVRTINRKLRGWANYFSLGPTGKPYGTINRYTLSRLHRWLCRKHTAHAERIAQWDALSFLLPSTDCIP